VEPLADCRQSTLY